MKEMEKKSNERNEEINKMKEIQVIKEKKQ